ncbi:MAG: zf-HC2 domain-containing protein [Phycisphaerae bacterium]|nr:zf-HC2 domain-containing protein [Phycisphaerae bacterium]
MNTCERSNRLNAYHDGELSPPEAVELERHVRGCPACAAELDGLRRLTHALASEAEPELPASALRRFHRAVDRVARNGIVRFAETFAALAATIMLVCVLNLAHGSPARQATMPVWEAAAVSESAGESGSPSAEDLVASWISQDLSRENGHD